MLQTRFLRAALACALLVLSTAAALAQEKTSTSPSLLSQGIRSAVEVKAMDLDVVATAKNGEMVNDLKKEELVVKVDGKPVPIDYFARVQEGELYGPDLATASPDVVLEATANDRGDKFLARHFLVFFDDEHLTPFERNRVIEGLRDFITRLTPSDRVSILSYGSGKRILLPFTSSKEDLLGTLDRLEKIAPGGLRWENDFRRTAVDAQRMRGSSRQTLIRSFAEQAFVRDKASLEDLRRAVAALAARSGKRVLLYVSNGLELHPGQILTQSLGPTPISQWDYSVVNEVEAVIAEANRAGVTVNAIDAKGITTDSDASESAPSPIGSFYSTQLLKEPLAGMAQETGGVLVQNRNSFKTAMDRIYREASSYYSIGVTLTAFQASAKAHKVEVATTRPGVAVRARRSYSPKTKDEALRDRMEMALLNPSAPGDFPVGVAIGAAKKGGGLGHRLAPYEVKIPIAALTFQDDGGARKAVVDIALAAVQDDGSRSGFRPDRQTITISKEEWEKAKGQVFNYKGEAKTGKGNFRFVATVRDVATDRIGVGSSAVRIE
jgi:VWFA-related protein